MGSVREGDLGREKGERSEARRKSSRETRYEG